MTTQGRFLEGCGAAEGACAARAGSTKINTGGAA
jgi:hypothetical protein